MSVPMTSSDLERWGTRGQDLLEDLHNYTPTVCPRMTEFGTVTQVREKHISRGSATSQGEGPRPAPQETDPYLCQNGSTSATKLGMVTRKG